MMGQLLLLCNLTVKRAAATTTFSPPLHRLCCHFHHHQPQPTTNTQAQTHKHKPTLSALMTMTYAPMSIEGE